MLSVFKTNKPSTTESVDIVENIVYQYLKPLGFQKHGRTLHRFVDGDISQVVHLQNGCPAKGIYGKLWVNLGIRVPECAERNFKVSEPQKKYYHEYDCNIRTCLGTFVDGKDTFYNLKKSPNKIGKDIVDRLEKYVMPIFDILNSRDAILKYRAKYSAFDEMYNHQLLLEEAMIYGRMGDISRATRLFNAYYQGVLKEYMHDLEHGKKTYMRKGERMLYHNTKTDKTETVTADKSRYVTIFNAGRGHLDHLEKLAEQLGIVLQIP